MNCLVNLVYLLIMFAFSLAYRGSFMGMAYLEMSSHGLWPLILVSLTLRSLGDPSGSTNFWGLVQVPNKFYPICLVAFFCLLSGMRIMWNLVAALAIGYAYAFLHFDRLMPSRRWIDSLEGRCCRGCAGVIGGPWVPPAGTSAFGASSGRYADPGNSSRLSLQGRTVQPAAGSSAFTAFAGSGNRLGDGSDGQPLSQPLAPMPPRSEQPAPGNEAA